MLLRPMRNNWRWHLDPRDPDYMDPPAQNEADQREDLAIDAYLERVMEDEALDQ